jgi:uncharacterized membrane protein
MNDITWIGQRCVAIAIVAFGVQNFIYGDFMMGRAPVWPSDLPGKLVWAYLSGAVLMVAGICILIGKKPRIAAIVVALLVLIWALLRHVIAGNFQWGTELTWLGKAFTLCGGAFAVAGTMPKEDGSLANKFPLVINSTHGFILLGRICLSAFMIICGIEHFMFVEFVKSLVPAWIPGDVFWTYFGGVALIAGGAGLLLNPTLRLAALLSGIMVFTWFIILHIPRAIAGMGDGNEWIAVVEALAVSGIAFVLAGKRDDRLRPNHA